MTLIIVANFALRIQVEVVEDVRFHMMPRSHELLLSVEKQGFSRKTSPWRPQHYNPPQNDIDLYHRQPCLTHAGGGEEEIGQN